MPVISPHRYDVETPVGFGVDEDQAFGIKIVLAVKPILSRGLHISALLLGGMGGLFYVSGRANRETSTLRSS
jgi:hypothetical protein